MESHLSTADLFQISQRFSNLPTSEGTHRLIGERAAEIVTSVSDAVELISSLEQLV
jgi:hypothetical protein